MVDGAQPLVGQQVSGFHLPRPGAGSAGEKRAPRGPDQASDQQLRTQLDRAGDPRAWCLGTTVGVRRPRDPSGFYLDLPGATTDSVLPSHQRARPRPSKVNDRLSSVAGAEGIGLTFDTRVLQCPLG